MVLTKIRRDLFVRPWRSLFTILGIAVGVAALVAIVSTTQNVERTQRALYDSASQADLTYWLWNAQPGLSTSLASDPRIESAELRREYVTRLLSGSEIMDVRLVGMADWSPEINKFDLVEGVLPGRGEMLLEISAARDLGVWIGDEVLYIDRSGRERSLGISGISRSPSFLSSAITRQAVAYVNSDVVAALLQVSGSNQLLLRAGEAENLAALARDVDRILLQRRIQHGAALIHDNETYVGKREIDAVLAVMAAFAGVGLLVSSMLVYNTLSSMVSEQAREIGILKALGASRLYLAALYLAEGLAYGVPGILAGAGIGLALGWQLLQLFARLGNAAVTFRVAPQGLYLGMISGLIVSLVASLVPALRASRMTVKEAIGNQGLASSFGRRGLERLLAGVRFWRLEWRMAIRNVLRRVGRTALTVSVIALSVAAFVAAFSAHSSVNSAISAIYDTYAMDAWVSFSPRADARMAEKLETLDSVVAAEAWWIADGFVSLTPARLWGVPAKTDLYQYALQDGRWYGEGENDAVVISAELAQRLALSVGDRVIVGADTKQRNVHVVGIVVDNTIFLGGQLAGKVFMTPALCGAITGGSRTGDIFAVQLRDDEEQAVQDITYRFAVQSPTVQLMRDEIQAASEASLYLSFSLAAMVFLMTLLGSLGIVNTVSLNLMDRRREIAVMRAIGARKSTLSLVYALEGLAMGVLGWLVGLLIGVPLSRLVIRQLESVLFDLPGGGGGSLVVIAGGFAVALSSVAGIVAFLRVGRQPTAKGLKYE